MVVAVEHEVAWKDSRDIHSRGVPNGCKDVVGSSRRSMKGVLNIGDGIALEVYTPSTIDWNKRCPSALRKTLK